MDHEAMEQFTVLKLNIDKLLELGKQQNERLADIQRKLELTSATVTSLTNRVDRMEAENSTSGSVQIPSELVSASVASLEKRVERIEENSTRNATTGTSVERKVPKELSANVKALHRSAEMKFRGDDNYHAPHNEMVTKFLEQQLKEMFEDKYDYRLIHRAVHRYYESRRRRVNDSKPERWAQVARNKENARRLARKRCLHKHRRNHLKKGELKYWEYVPIEAMSSEEESPDGTIYTHKPSWRSDALDALIRKLDQRIKKKKPTKIIKSVGDPVYRPTPGGLKKWMFNPSNDVICEQVIEEASSSNMEQDTSIVEHCSSSPASQGHSRCDSWEGNFQDFSELAMELEDMNTTSSATVTTEMLTELSRQSSSTSVGEQSSHADHATSSRHLPVCSPPPYEADNDKEEEEEEEEDSDNDSDFSFDIQDDDDDDDN